MPSSADTLIDTLQLFVHEVRVPLSAFLAAGCLVHRDSDAALSHEILQLSRRPFDVSPR